MRVASAWLLLVSCLLVSCGGESVDSHDRTASANESTTTPDPRIRAVEQGLLPRFLIEGEPRPSWSIEERMAHHNVPGMSVAVMVDGEIVWAKGYGVRDSESNVPVDAETLFQAASISKPVAGLAALRLVKQGSLTLDAPINDSLTSWKVPDNSWTREQPVTLRHLLSHRGGTTVHGFPGYAQDDAIPSVVEILDGVSPANTDSVRVDKLPGESFRYSGGGTTVMQLAMLDVTGTTFPELMSEWILEPAGLTRSTFLHPEPTQNAARAHVGDDSVPLEGHSHRYPELAAAGLWTTPSELLQLSQILTGPADESFFPSELWREVVESDDGYFVFGRNEPGDGSVLVHGGANHGFRARWFTYDDGRGAVAIMTNSDSGSELIREILSATGEVYGWAQDAVSVRKETTLDEKETAAIVGKYTFSPDEEARVEIRQAADGLLWMDSPFGDSFRVYASSPVELFGLDGPEMRLEPGEKGGSVLVVQDELRLIKVSNTP